MNNNQHPLTKKWKAITTAGAAITLAGTIGLIATFTNQDTKTNEETTATTPSTETTTSTMLKQKPNTPQNTPNQPDNNQTNTQETIEIQDLPKDHQEVIEKALSTDEKELQDLYEKAETQLKPGETANLDSGISITVSNPTSIGTSTTVHIKATSTSQERKAFSSMLFNATNSQNKHEKATTESIYDLPQLEPNGNIEGQLTFPILADAVYYTDTETGTVVTWDLTK